MKTKNIIIMVVAAISVIAFLFLPFMTLSFMESISENFTMPGFGDSLEVSFFDILTNGMDFGVIDILPLICGILIIIGAFINNKKFMLSSAIIGTLALVAQIGSAAESFAPLKEFGLEVTAFDVLGLGYWIALVGFFANTIIISIGKKDSEQ